MILSAGLGTRLHPITQNIPKPLIPVLNIPNIIHTIDLLKSAGITEIVINLHHLASQIRSYLEDGNRLAVRIHYTQETILLGTGGGIKNAERFFKSEPFIVANCDFVTNINLKPYIHRHFDRNAVATMILVPNVPGDYTPVYFLKSGNLSGIGTPKATTDERAVFTGIHILSANALSFLKPTPSGINQDLYPQLLKTQGAFVELASNAFWLDTGDTHALYSSSISLLNQLVENENLKNWVMHHLDFKETAPNVWIPSASPTPRASVHGPCILGNPELIDARSTVGPNVILSSQSAVAGATKVRDTLAIGPNVIERDLGRGLLFENKNLLQV